MSLSRYYHKVSLTPLLAHTEHLHYHPTTNPLDGVNGIHVINLKRRPDRLAAFFNSSGFTADTINVFEAVDAQALPATWTTELEQLFGNNHYISKRTLLACSWSHYKLWQHIAATKDEYHMIFEDDGIFVSDFIQQWNEKYAPNMPCDAAMVYLGGARPRHELPKYNESMVPVNEFFGKFTKTTRFWEAYDPPMDTSGDAQTPRRWSFHTNIAYMLSSRGAKILVDYIKSVGGLRVPADSTLIRLMYLADQPYTTIPHLVNIPATTLQFHNADSDVQFNSDVIEGGPWTKTRKEWLLKNKKQ